MACLHQGGGQGIGSTGDGTVSGGPVVRQTCSSASVSMSPQGFGGHPGRRVPNSGVVLLICSLAGADRSQRPEGRFHLTGVEGGYLAVPVHVRRVETVAFTWQAWRGGYLAVPVHVGMVKTTGAHTLRVSPGSGASAVQ